MAEDLRQRNNTIETCHIFLTEILISPIARIILEYMFTTVAKIRTEFIDEFSREWPVMSIGIHDVWGRYDFTKSCDIVFIAGFIKLPFDGFQLWDIVVNEANDSELIAILARTFNPYCTQDRIRQTFLEACAEILSKYTIPL